MAVAGRRALCHFNLSAVPAETWAGSGVKHRLTHTTCAWLKPPLSADTPYVHKRGREGGGRGHERQREREKTARIEGAGKGVQCVRVCVRVCVRACEKESLSK